MLERIWSITGCSSDDEDEDEDDDEDENDEGDNCLSTILYNLAINWLFACRISPLVFLVALNASDRIFRTLLVAVNFLPAAESSNMVNKLDPKADSYRLLKGNLMVMIVSFFGSNGWPPGGIPDGNDCPEGLKDPGTDPGPPTAPVASLAWRLSISGSFAK